MRAAAGPASESLPYAWWHGRDGIIVPRVPMVTARGFEPMMPDCTRSLAEAVAGTGVTVNTVVLGPTRSEILGNFMAKQAADNGITTEEAERG